MKILFTACSLLFTLVAYSQPKINFTSGLNISNLTHDFVSEYGFDSFREEYIALGGSATSQAKNSVRVGFYFSALTDFYLKESVFLRSGIKFQNTGDSYFFKTNDVVLVSNSGSESDERYKFRQRLGYITIPVNLGLECSDKVSLYGGFSPSINVSNVLRNNFFEQDGDRVKERWDKVDNPVPARDVVIFINGGINYLMPGGSVDYFLDLGFNYSLTSVYETPVDSVFDEANAWNVDIGFGVRI